MYVSYKGTVYLVFSCLFFFGKQRTHFFLTSSGAKHIVQPHLTNHVEPTKSVSSTPVMGQKHLSLIAPCKNLPSTFPTRVGSSAQLLAEETRENPGPMRPIALKLVKAQLKFSDISIAGRALDESTHCTIVVTEKDATFPDQILMPDRSDHNQSVGLHRANDMFHSSKPFGHKRSIGTYTKEAWTSLVRKNEHTSNRMTVAFAPSICM